MEILFWIWVLTWMFKTAATDVLHAVKGTPNPRYELKREKARAAGQPVQGQPRYGTREWVSDLYSDALAANTDRRRAKTAGRKAAGGSIDDLVKVTSDAKAPARTTRRGNPPQPSRATDAADRAADGVEDAHAPRRPAGITNCDECGREAHINDLTPMSNGSDVQLWCDRHDRPTAPSADEPQPAEAPTPTGGQSKLATVIPMFPILKEPTMANAEITGLPTAIAFAEGMANAHKGASTAGGEQYVAALRGFDVGDGAISTVQHAREMSTQAAAAWERAAEEMKKQTTVKEAYQAVPDAGNKRFVTGE